MKMIEREIKILSHVNEIEFILDELGISSRKEIQNVLSVRIGRESHKLKIKTSSDGKSIYLFCKKSSAKTNPDVVNKNFSNKLEEEIILTKEEFKISEMLFRKMFEAHTMMDYVIEKKRYNTFMGYNIDICQVIQSNDKSKYYTNRFIEIEENMENENEKIDLETLMKILIPKETDIIAITCGIRNLNRFYKSTSMIRAKQNN